MSPPAIQNIEFLEPDISERQLYWQLKCLCVKAFVPVFHTLIAHEAVRTDEWEPKARRALSTLVAQLFSCPDGEHCFTRERAHWQLFCCGNKKVAVGCSQTHSRGNRNVAYNDRTLMFQCGRAHWQLNSRLLAAVRCTSLVSWVIQICLS